MSGEERAWCLCIGLICLAAVAITAILVLR
jgi:hypothetical protein